MQIEVTDQIPVLNAQLMALYRRLSGNLTPLMAAIGGVLESSTRQRFADKKAPDGNAWADLLPATQQAKRGRGGGILVDRGDLMRSITYHANQHSVAIGTDRHYGKYHQMGTSVMVARPFLGLSSEDKRTLHDLINDFLAEVWHG